MAILIAGDDFLVKEGVAVIVRRMGYIPESWDDGMVKEDAPDLIICLLDKLKDISVEWITTCLSRAPIVLIADQFSSEDIRRVITHGVKNIVTKRCSEEEIENAIALALQQQRFYCSSILDALSSPGKQESEQLALLSKREREVLNLVLHGHTSTEISEKLFVSIHTVHSHRKSILKKFQLKSPAELFVFAIENNLKQAL